MDGWTCPLCGAPVNADMLNTWEDDWIGTLECDSGCFIIDARIYTTKEGVVEAMEATYRLLQAGAKHISADDIKAINGGQRIPDLGGNNVD